MIIINCSSDNTISTNSYSNTTLINIAAGLLNEIIESNEHIKVAESSSKYLEYSCCFIQYSYYYKFGSFTTVCELQLYPINKLRVFVAGHLKNEYSEFIKSYNEYDLTDYNSTKSLMAYLRELLNLEHLGRKKLFKNNNLPHGSYVSQDLYKT